MRRKFFAIVLLFTLFTVLTYSQVTDAEKTLSMPILLRVGKEAEYLP